MRIADKGGFNKTLGNLAEEPNELGKPWRKTLSEFCWFLLEVRNCAAAFALNYLSLINDSIVFSR